MVILSTYERVNKLINKNIIFIYGCFFNPKWQIKQKENVIIIKSYVLWPQHVVENRYIIEECIKSIGTVKFIRF
jgi:hypothetical protein